MATPAVENPVESRVHYLNANYGIRSWLFTTDHKRIALLYLVSITFFSMIGGAAAVLMRLNLIEPQGAIVAPVDRAVLRTLAALITEATEAFEQERSRQPSG